jgi:hypothetical protein
MIACPIDLEVNSDITDGAKDDINPMPDPSPRQGGTSGMLAVGSTTPPLPGKCRMELSWCNHDSCYQAIREKVVGIITTWSSLVLPWCRWCTAGRRGA